MQRSDFVHRIHEIVETHGSRPALWVNSETYNYTQLWKQAEQVAAHLRGKDGAFCAMIAEKSFESYAAILGIMLAGKIYVPIAPITPEQIVVDKLRDCFCQLLIADHKNHEAACHFLQKSEAGGSVFTFSSSAPNDVRISNVDGPNVKNCETVAPDGACSLYFTSGSTGRPKAIITTQQAMSAYADALHQKFSPLATDRVSQLTGLEFDFSMHDIILAWTVGGCLYAIGPDDSLSLSHFISEHKLTIWSSVPSTLYLLGHMRGLEPDSYPHIRLSLVGGEIVPPQTVANWISAAPNQTFFNIYGPTETAMVVTACQWKEEYLLEKRIPIGWPLGRNKIRIVDKDLRSLSPGTAGQIAIGGLQVSSGYFNDPDRTSKSFVVLPDESGTWYLTGDIGHFDPERGYIFHGREDAQLKIRGHRLERADLELMLRHAACTDDVAIIGWPLTEQGNLIGLAAFINESPFDVTEIRTRIRKEMPEYARPSNILIGPLPRNKNNKTDYQALFDLMKAKK